MSNVRASESKVPLPRADCSTYHSGHNPHWIQNRLAVESISSEYRRGTVVSVDEDGFFSVDFDGEVLKLWNHDPARLRACIEERGSRVGLARYHLLYVPADAGRRYAICVDFNGPSPCVAPQGAPKNVEEAVEQTRTFCGFTGPIDKLLREPNVENPRLD